jgi:outer membrane receptor protein involved in Fe transport
VVARDARQPARAAGQLDAAHTTGRWLQRAGIDVRWLHATYDYRGGVDFADDYPFPNAPAQDFARALAPEPQGEHVALYYTVRGRLTDTLIGEAGLRWDEQSYGDDADDHFGPRLNLAWSVTERTRLLASWGRYQQFQGIEELPVEDGVAEFSPAQRADHTVLGLEHALDDAYSLRIELVRKDYSSLRTRYENLYDPLSLAPELRWDRVSFTPSSALAEGAELLLTRRPVDEWSGWFGYAWSRVRDRVAGDAVPRSWDQTHTLNLGALWSAGPWQATLAAQYHTGWPVTPIALDAQGDAVLGQRNSARYADYATVDARLSYAWKLPRSTLTLHADVTNLADRRNPCCTDLTYDTSGATPTLERELRHWLPLVPNVGLLWQF